MKDIKVTIENYNGRKITYIVPETAEVDIWSAYTFIGDIRQLIEVNINLKNSIIIEEES